jgi:hypothetical protein
MRPVTAIIPGLSGGTKRSRCNRRSENHCQYFAHFSLLHLVVAQTFLDEPLAPQPLVVDKARRFTMTGFSFDLFERRMRRVRAYSPKDESIIQSAQQLCDEQHKAFGA